MDYISYFLITLVLSSIFAMAGTGSGIAVIPVLHMLGVDFNLAKAAGLFTGFCSTATSTVMNFKRDVLDMRFAAPLAFGFLIFAPLGAQMSRFVDMYIVKWGFVVFLLFSASMMFFFDRKARVRLSSSAVLWVSGAAVGMLAGLLGVGGGNILLPLLIIMGFDAKKVSIAVSFIIPFSTMGSFVSYASFVNMDWILLAVCASAAIMGGYIGNYLMHYRLSQGQIKKVIAVILYMLAAKMGWSML